MSPKVSQRHKEARRAQILDVAARCFARKGYAATTIQEILQEAGVSAGGVYTYFQSKEEIYLALAARDLERELARFSAALAGEPTAWGRLERLLRLYMPVGFQDPEQQEFTQLYLLQFLPSTLTNPRLKAILQERAGRIHDVLVRVLEAGVQSGEFRQLDPAAVAALVVAAGDGLRLHALTLGTLAPAESMYRSWLESIRQAVMP